MWKNNEFFLLMRTLHEFARQFFRTRCWFCVDVRVFSIAVEWIVLEFDSIRKISDGLTKSPGILPCMTFIPGLSERTPPNEHRVLWLRTLRILSFMTKRNTRFRATLSIEKRGLWHLGTVHSPQLLRFENARQLTLFTNSFIHLHFLPF